MLTSPKHSSIRDHSHSCDTPFSINDFSILDTEPSRFALRILESLYTRSIMNVSRARFTHSRQNGTLAESRSEEGSLTGSSAQPDTWRNPHASPPFQPGTHTDRAITARGEGPRPAVFRPICCVSVQGRDGRGWGATSRRIRFQLNQSYD